MYLIAEATRPCMWPGRFSSAHGTPLIHKDYSISGHTKVVEYLVSFAAQDKNGSIVFAKDAYGTLVLCLHQTRINLNPTGKTPLQWAMDRLQRIKMSATSSSTSLAEVQMQLQQIVNIISNFIQQQHGQADSMRDAGSGGENSTYQVQLEAITNKVASMTTVDDIDEIGILLGNLSL